MFAQTELLRPVTVINNSISFVAEILPPRSIHSLFRNSEIIDRGGPLPIHDDYIQNLYNRHEKLRKLKKSFSQGSH